MITPKYPPEGGGLEYHVQRLANAMVHANWSVVIQTTTQHVSSEFKNRRMTIIKHRSIAEPMGSPIALGIYRSIRRQAMDLVHVHGPYHLVSVMGMLAVRRGVPVILTLHGRPYFSGVLKRTIQSVFERSVLKFIANRANLVIALTKADVRFLYSIGVAANKISLIPNAVDTNFWAPATICNEAPASWMSKSILYVGFLNERKNVHLLLEAFAKIAGRHENMNLVVIGNGPERKHLQALAEKLEIADQTKFISKVSSEELRNAYRYCSAFVLPSHSEGLPTVLLEAMSCKAIALVSGIGASLETVRTCHNGYLFEPNNPFDLAKKLELALSTKEIDRRKIREDARRTVIEKYDNSMMIQKIKDCYLQVLSEGLKNNASTAVPDMR